MIEAGICDLSACLQECFAASNLHNTAAGHSRSPLTASLCFSRQRKRINHMETIVNNRPADMSSPQTLGD